MFDSYSEIFAERAHSYHAAMQAVPNARDAEFQAVVQPIADRPGGLVCDMPAGGGYLSAYLPRRLGYIGIEPVPQFIEAPGADTADTLQAPLVDVPLSSGSVDYVISLAGLHHEVDLLPVFGEMRRLTRRGGRVVIADVSIDTPPARFLNGFVDQHNPLGHKGHFFDSRTRECLSAAGLAIESDELVEVPWMFSSLSQAGDFCGKLFGITGPTSMDVVAALENDLGFRRLQNRLYLQWSLRLFVCTPD
jgi:SAM-dependent methyltransferase